MCKCIATNSYTARSAVISPCQCANDTQRQASWDHRTIFASGSFSCHRWWHRSTAPGIRCPLRPVDFDWRNRLPMPSVLRLLPFRFQTPLWHGQNILGRRDNPRGAKGTWKSDGNGTIASWMDYENHGKNAFTNHLNPWRHIQIIHISIYMCVCACR